MIIVDTVCAFLDKHEHDNVPFYVSLVLIGGLTAGCMFGVRSATADSDVPPQGAAIAEVQQNE